MDGRTVILYLQITQVACILVVVACSIVSLVMNKRMAKLNEGRAKIQKEMFDALSQRVSALERESRSSRPLVGGRV